MREAETDSRPVFPLLVGAEWVDDHPGGLNRYFADLLAALEKDGEPEPSAVVVGPAVGSPASVFPASLVTVGLPRRLEAVALQTDKLSSAADVVDVHFALYGAAALLHRQARKRALVVHFHGPWADEAAAQRGNSALADVPKRLIERWVYRRADQLIVLTSAFKDLLVEQFDVDPKRVHIVPPGVNLDRFAVRPQLEARDELGLDKDGLVVVSPRRLVRRMGLDQLVRAWALTARRSTDRLVLIGEGPEADALKALAMELDVADSVVFTGRVSDDDLVTWYQAASVVAVPSRSLEGFGLVVIEAAACGTPSVVTNIGGLAEAAGGLSADLIIEPDDVDALASALERFRNNSPVSPQECRSFAERHDWASVARRHRAIYSDANALHRGTLQGADRVPGGVPLPRVVVLTHSGVMAGAEIAIARLGSALKGSVDFVFLLGEDGPLSHELERRGLEWEVLSLGAPTASVRRESLGIPGPRHALAGWHGMRAGLKIAQRVRELDPDLIQTSSLKAHFYGAIVALRSRRPLTWYLHDRITEDYLPAPAVAALQRLAQLTTRGVMANSHASLATLSRTRGIRAVVGCPVEPPSTVAPRPEQFTIGLVGRLAPWKGHDVALRAFAEAFRDRTDVRCRVIGAPLFGEDDYAAELVDLVSSLGIEKQVEFRGHCSDMTAEFAELNVAVHSSIIPEPLGLVVIEAQAHGVPILAAAAGGVLETVEHEVDGLLHEPGSVSSLAEGMRRLEHDPALAAKLSVNGLVSAKRFAPAIVAERAERFYRSVIERTRARW